MNEHAKNTFIPLSVPSIQGNEWAYVKECLDTGWVSSVGSFVDRFERGVADRIGVKHAVAAVNGTSALHTAYLAMGIRPDDEVIVSTLTFIAPVNAIRYAGAWPVFIDSDPANGQMDPEALRNFLQRGCAWRDGECSNIVTGRRVVAVVPVHILGHAADIEPIAAIARQYGLKVIEDASEALGTLYKGQPVGRHGDAACFSFNGNKILTTGGGGMLVTNSDAVAQRSKYLTTQAKDDPIEYIHGDVGYNYRLTNVAAAIGCAQLENLDAYVADKRRIAARYAAGLKNVPGLTLMAEENWCASTYWMYTVRIDAQVFGMTSRQLLRALDAWKIQTRPLWQPIHLSPAHGGNVPPSLPVAERLAEDSLSLPCSVGLSEADQTRVISAICELAAR